MFFAYSYTLIIFQIEYFNATFESVILESVLIKSARASAQPQYALTLPKRCYCWIRSLNQIWCEVYGLRQNAASFWKTTFSFFYVTVKLRSFSVFFFYTTQFKLHIFFFVRRHFLFSVYLQITNTKPSTKIYTYSKEQEKIFLPSDKKVLLSPPIMQVK